MCRYSSTFTESLNGFLNHQIVVGFLENKGKCGHRLSPDQCEDIVIVRARRSMKELFSCCHGSLEHQFPEIRFPNKSAVLGWHHNLLGFDRIVDLGQHAVVEILFIVHFRKISFEILKETRLRKEERSLRSYFACHRWALTTNIRIVLIGLKQIIRQVSSRRLTRRVSIWEWKGHLHWA